MSDALDIEVEQAGAGRAIVVFRGEYGVPQVEALGDRLSALVAENELVIADFSKAVFVDAAIISLLVETRREAETKQRGFRIQVGTESFVYRVFEIAGVLSFLECAPSREEALGEN